MEIKEERRLGAGGGREKEKEGGVGGGAGREVRTAEGKRGRE